MFDKKEKRTKDVVEAELCKSAIVDQGGSLRMYSIGIISKYVAVNMGICGVRIELTENEEA